MFDDLRQQTFSEPEEEKKSAEEESAALPKSPAPARKARKKRKLVLGMTGPQRFAVSVLLMLMVCVAGLMFLFVMGKIGF